MTIPDYTLVIGVDKGHLEQLSLVWSTWAKHKPSLLQRPIIVFYNESVHISDIHQALNPIPGKQAPLQLVRWHPDCEYIQKTPERWYNPQRQRMLAGFLHVPAKWVETEYWLKLDLDAVATGQDDWVDPKWFEGQPAIIASPWSYTKPANQMLELDEWVTKFQIPGLYEHPPLNLAPVAPNVTMVRHPRIASWCGFFRADFNKFCSEIAEETCGKDQMPCPSQDGMLWYCAARSHQGIKRVDMKSKGWKLCSKTKGVREAAKEAMSK